MKINTIFSFITLAVATKVSAECFAEKLGKPCCTETLDVVRVDENGQWGMENGQFCGLQSFNNNYDLNLERRSLNNYMNKVKIEKLCPEDLLEIKKGVNYPTVDSLTYYSTTTETNRTLTVLVPPNYSPKKKYPVLYLLHGIMTDGAWMIQDGFGTIAIPGNLAHQKKAKEMFIVLPDQYAPSPGTEVEPALNQEFFNGYDNFINDLVNDIMPFMKKQYSIKTDRKNTAISGYSFGGRNSLYIGITRSDLFGYVGSFSPAPGLVPGDDIFTGHFDGLYQEKELKFKHQPYLTMLSCGTNDTVVFDFPKQYHEILKTNKQEHIWYEITGHDHMDNESFSSPYHNFLTSIFDQVNEKPKTTTTTKKTTGVKTKITKVVKVVVTKFIKVPAQKTKKNN
ncbi:alpha/beta-hydrolase [Piromyces finnis]|uniref:Alpha/beta-hydrolase n=1 Tax=Piromyces finnis TaxID=1754191 RepID=A0A1Y1UY72_9FUNG|nr:alpha/beta-hydrolase [Piromyces finnis]|eukprot:ORX42666.1 alpha/beta-hydrolase [Piromyces finnis]